LFQTCVITLCLAEAAQQRAHQLRLRSRQIRRADVSPAVTGETTGPLSAVSCALVGDVAYVIRIETLRSTPLIVDKSTKASLAFDRAFTLWPRLIESSPAELMPRPRAASCRMPSMPRATNSTAPLEIRRATVLIPRSVAYRPWPCCHEDPWQRGCLRRRMAPDPPVQRSCPPTSRSVRRV
jgi:hypothetical protein